MKLRVLVAFLVLGTLGISSGTSQQLDSAYDLSSFLKDMEKKASDVDAKEGKWVRRSLSRVLEDERTGASRSQQVMETVAQLESLKLTFSKGVLGYLKGAHALLVSSSKADWDAWHDQLAYFAENAKERKEAERYLDLSRGLFRQGLLYESAAATWYLRGGEWSLLRGANGEPEIRFAPGNLVCLSKSDSLLVRDVAGVFQPLQNRFQAEGGLVDWDRTIRAGEFNAQLGAFEVRLKGSSIATDQARLTSTMFDVPLEGQLSLKVQREENEKKRTYPRFESQSGRVVLNDLLPGVSFEGGLQIRGSKLSGSGSNGQWAKLIIMNHDTTFIQCWSDEVLFSETSVDAAHARMSMRLGEDSLFHPDIQIRYLDDLKVFRAVRQEDGVGQQPFVDTYHMMEIEVDAIEWSMDAPHVVFRRLTSDRPDPAAFRSLDCFEKEVYNQMMGLDHIHPLAELSRYLTKRGVQTFYTDEYADFLGLQEEQARMMLIGLTNAGYVDLDLSTRYCEVKPRAERHIKCKKGVVDFDVIALYAEPERTVTMATLSLNNLRLNLDGIKPFAVSDAQDVTFSPFGGRVAVGRNRELEFDGIVNAGKFELTGFGFGFDYEAFTLNVRRAESLRIQTEEFGYDPASGPPKLRFVESAIEELTGTLEIDNPNNKSGWKSEFYTEFPILTSREVSHVYYDRTDICDGAYHRDDFNYALDPFVIDSLDNFSRDDLYFTGELLAGGIVPDLDEPLRLMEDYSLGFTRVTPTNGYPLYGDLGTVTGHLSLNLGGLHGPGTIDFFTSRLEGEDHTLVPDSAFGRTTHYFNASKPDDIPVVEASVTDFALHPYGERLNVRSTPSDSLQFFGEEVHLNGQLNLVETRMTGEGTFHFERADLSSNDFVMTTRHIDSDLAAFALQGGDLDEVAFGTQNVSAHVDFDARRGDFRAHEGATMIDLPAIRYQCLMDEFSWFMDEERLDLMNTLIDPAAMSFQELANRDQSNFFSQHEEQDGLHFLSPRATYKVDEATVTCTNVKSIAVADAEIKPGDGLVVVRRDAEMDELRGAEVLANDVTRYHRLYDANVRIKGRLSYEGAATKTYLDAQGLEWPIRFNELAVDTAHRTYGHGMIRSTDRFFLSPQFAFQGRVHLEAGRENLEFEGGAQMQFECDEFANEWVEFIGVINPDDVAIPIDSLVTEMGKSHLGVGWTYNSGGIMSMYPTFFTKKPVRSDVSFFTPRGYLRYDSRKDRYVVCEDDKLKNPSLPGNLTQMTRGNCEVTQLGQAPFPLSTKNLLDQRFIGEILSKSGQMTLKGGMVVDMPLHEDILLHLADVLSEAQEASGLGYSSTTYEYMLREMLGVDASASLIRDLDLLGVYKKGVPKDAQHALVLHGMEWNYDKYDDQWISEGEIGIATLGENNVWRSLRGKVVLNRDKQELTIYLHLNSKHWYFMQWKAGVGILGVQAREPQVEGQQTLELVMAGLKEGDKELKDGTRRFKAQWLNGTNFRSDFTDNFREFDD